MHHACTCVDACLPCRDPTNKTLSYIVDRLLLARPDANLLSRIKPVHDAKLRKDLVKFVRRNMKQFGDCWVDSHVVRYLHCIVYHVYHVCIDVYCGLHSCTHRRIQAKALVPCLH